MYNLDWSPDGTLKYWTPGLKSWVQTELDKESIDKYYDAVGNKIDEKNELGPRPTTKHLDGKSSYSPCNYCDFANVCNSYERMSTSEFKDHATKLTQELWANRGVDKT